MGIQRDCGARYSAAPYFGLAAINRGGSWNNNSDNAACAYRNNNNPHNRNDNLGFRCASTSFQSARANGSAEGAR